MNDTYDHMQAWGAPKKYRQDYPDSDLPWPLSVLAADVRSAANWYAEQDRALAAMIEAGDHEAIRSWDREALEVIGRETAEDEDDDGVEYADRIMDALEALADAVAEEKRA